MLNELGWDIQDREYLKSPVDYHEIRGHLRIGTLILEDKTLLDKIQKGLPLTNEEDIKIRSIIQKVNEDIGSQTGLTSSVIHYLLWNVFRSCCPRISKNTHCTRCDDNCSLPHHYRDLGSYENGCLFATFCKSVNEENKVVDPPYIGHYY